MELKTLWLGLVLSLAAFAVKTGLGWAYLWQAGRLRLRLAACLGILILYGAVFAALAFLVTKINLLANSATLLPLWQHGVILHWLTALMLCLWGLILLRRGGEAGRDHGRECHSRGWLGQNDASLSADSSFCHFDQREKFPEEQIALRCAHRNDRTEQSAVIASGAKQSCRGVLDCFVALLLAMTHSLRSVQAPQSKLKTHRNDGLDRSAGWLALVLPCPVCLSVILMSTATLVVSFPEQAALATTALFAAFMLIAALGGVLALILKTTGSGSAENNLGLAMLMVAAYFMLTALIAPHFSELGRIYRIAAYAADGRTAAQPGSQLLVAGTIGLLFMAGFLVAKKRREENK